MEDLKQLTDRLIAHTWSVWEEWVAKHQEAPPQVILGRMNDNGVLEVGLTPGFLIPTKEAALHCIRSSIESGKFHVAVLVSEVFAVTVEKGAPPPTLPVSKNPDKVDALMIFAVTTTTQGFGLAPIGEGRKLQAFGGIERDQKIEGNFAAAIPARNFN